MNIINIGGRYSPHPLPVCLICPLSVFYGSGSFFHFFFQLHAMPSQVEPFTFFPLDDSVQLLSAAEHSRHFATSAIGFMQDKINRSTRMGSISVRISVRSVHEAA
jgi:hypothetical protein